MCKFRLPTEAIKFVKPHDKIPVRGNVPIARKVPANLAKIDTSGIKPYGRMGRRTGIIEGAYEVLATVYNDGIYNEKEVEAYLAKESIRWLKDGRITQYKVLLFGENGRNVSTRWIDVGQFRSLSDLIGNYSEYTDVVDSIDSFIIFVKSPRVGGDSENNDCLWDCIPERLRSKEWKSAAEFKKWLGLKRDEKVPVTMIDKISEKLNISIYVRGDKRGVFYESKFKSTRGLRLDIDLKNEHYSLTHLRYVPDMMRRDAKGPIWKPLNTAYDAKHVYFYTRCRNNNKMIKHYIVNGDEITEEEVEYNTILKYKQKPIETQTSLYYVNEKKTRENAYEEIRFWVRARNALYDATEGKLDLFIYGSPAKAALTEWRQTAMLYDPDPISSTESDWIDKSHKSQTTYCAVDTEAPYTGPAVQLDFNSFYPSIMANEDFLVPLKAPEYETLPEDYFDEYDIVEEEGVELGHYRCHIMGEIPVFTYNKHDDCYTSYDISVALMCGVKVKMIQDGKPNAALYRKGLTRGSFIFGDYVKRFYELKKKGISEAKMMLNVLNGALVEKNKQTLSSSSSDDLEVRQNKKLEEVVPVPGTNYKVFKAVLVDEKERYATPFARVYPFIIGAGRMIMTMLLLDQGDNLLRVNTDGFILKKEVKFTKARDGTSEGIELGQYHVEHRGDTVTISKLNNISWSNGQETKTAKKAREKKPTRVTPVEEITI